MCLYCQQPTTAQNLWQNWNLIFSTLIPCPCNVTCSHFLYLHLRSWDCQQCWCRHRGSQQTSPWRRQCRWWRSRSWWTGRWRLWRWDYRRNLTEFCASLEKEHENNIVPVFHKINSPHLVSRSARLSYTRPMAIMAIKFIWNRMRKIIMEILKSELQLKVHTTEVLTLDFTTLLNERRLVLKRRLEL